MDSSSIQLSGSELAGFELIDGQFRLRFARAYIVKTMTGSAEKTLWWQSGDLVMDGAEAHTPLPTGPAIGESGDIDDNIYTYRDMIPLPLTSMGRMRCALRLRDYPEPIIVTGQSIRMEMQGTPNYIRHLRPKDESSRETAS